jgi:uncharacterized delta-60 repeat protein
LNTDGSLDANFNASANNMVFTIVVQTNGGVLVGGVFTNLDGMNVGHLGRLNANGSLDNTFNSLASGSIAELALQPNNQILAAGNFTNSSGVARTNIARLNIDGSIDTNFTAGANGGVSAMTLQANGKILVGGGFTALDGTTCNFIGRLNTNGTLDTTFNPVANQEIAAVTLQKNGQILLGGYFTNLDGSLRSSVGRLNNNDAETESITNTSSSITWLRGGSSPEVSRTTFAIFTNGSAWTYIGDGTRIAGGWQLTGVSVPINASLQLSGFADYSGFPSQSSVFIQSYWGAPCVVTQPAPQNVILGSTATMSVVAGGSSPLVYQWQFNGVPLANGGKINGAASATLSINSLASSNVGAYSVVITNSCGSVTSVVASLSAATAVTIDTFNAGLGLIYSTVLQSDNRVIIGGDLNTANGGVWYFGICRAATNGLLDTSFTPYEATVYACYEQMDGKLVIGGTFTDAAGPPYFRRLNPDGSLDSSFSAAVNGHVYAMMAQPDGKLLVAGNFTTLDNQPDDYIGRINANGSVDTNFHASASNIVYCVALQTNGQIVIGGNFTNIEGSVHNYIARLNSDGSLDTNFNASISYYYAAGNPVYCLAIQPNGQILVGGYFFLAEGG